MTIVVGGGLAAATAVTELRAQGYEGEVTLLAAERHLPYERPPLSKDVLKGTKDVEAAYVHDADWYRDNAVTLQLDTRVTAVDTSARVVTAASGAGRLEVPYDRLLLATGAVPRRFALADEVSVPVYLRTIDDSLALRERLREGVRVVIVGAGWIGLEVASAAREAGAEVTVFEAAELPLVRVLGPEAARVFAELHRYHGVDLRLGAQVTASDLAAADVVGVGVGAAPSTELAEAAGLAVDNGILVDAALRTSAPGVFAIGDVANHDHPVLGRRIDRVVPVVEAIAASRAGVVISVDTNDAEVARHAIAAGAAVVNDTSGLGDPRMAEVVARGDPHVVITHSVGPPRAEKPAARYDDVVAEVRSFLLDRIARAEAAGVPRDRIVIDPGHDLDKNTLHTLELTRRLDEIAAIGRPLLVAVSNKDFVGESIDRPQGERLAGSLAAMTACILKGARIVRMHDVAATVDAVRMVEAILGVRAPARLEHNTHPTRNV